MALPTEARKALHGGLATALPNAGLHANAVSSSDPLATAAAIAILEEGGNAFDAALCASMVLAVTLPMSSGIGGDGVFLLWDAAHTRGQAINALGVAPAQTEPVRRFLRPASAHHGEPLLMPPKTGILTASLPALPWGWAALARHCSFAIPDIAAPAVAFAKDGFVPDKKFRRWTNANFAVIQGDRNLREVFAPFVDVQVSTLDGLLRQNPLADFLALFARTALDPDPAWASVLASEAVRSSEAQGGAFRLGDFAESTLCRNESPIGLPIGEHQVLTSGGTTQGYMAILAARLMVDLQTPRVDPITLAAKVFHVIYEDRLREFGDRGERQSDWLLDKLGSGSLAQLAERVDRLDFRSVAEGKPIQEDGDTTYFYVVDDAGNAASCIQSLSLGFGSGVCAPGIGLIFNSRLTRGVSLEDGAPNALAPRVRPVNTIFPVLGLRGQRLSFLGGTAGGDVQVQINAHAIHMLATRASLDAWPLRPRWKYSPVTDVFDQANGAAPTVSVERPLDPRVCELLRESGLEVAVQKDVGGSAKYAYAGTDGAFASLDEGRDGGSSVVR